MVNLEYAAPTDDESINDLIKRLNQTRYEYEYSDRELSLLLLEAALALETFQALKSAT